jgi:hypothetical protein
MPVDITLVKTVLNVLNNNVSRSNLTEEVIGIDCETILRKPLAAHQIRAALAECASHAWAHERFDEFGMPVWNITAPGEIKLKTL